MRLPARRMLTAIRAALTIIAAVSIGPTHAQNAGLQNYDVELVIFRALSPNTTAEHWDTEVSEATAQLAIPDEDQPVAAAEAPAPPVEAPNAFPALPAAKFKLTAIEDSLRRSRNYQPLAHIGWTQPGFPRNDARYLPIGPLVPAGSGLSGQIALSRGRYLHLTLDLAYDAPATASEAAQRFVLRQTRRMRSNERHYIDHPKFGVIAIVTPSSE